MSVDILTERFPGATIGYGALIAPGAVIAPGAHIDVGAVVAHNATVGEDAYVGACAYVGDGASVGDDAYVGRSTIIGDNVVVRAGAAVEAYGIVRAGSIVRARETQGVRELEEGAEVDLEIETVGATMYLAHVSIVVNLTRCRRAVRVPAVFKLEGSVLGAIEDARGAGARGLDMARWHACPTTNCLAGWACVLAGADGAALEEMVGAATAGGLIYYASTGRLPNWYASDEDALADLRRHAAIEATMWEARGV